MRLVTEGSTIEATQVGRTLLIEVDGQMLAVVTTPGGETTPLPLLAWVVAELMAATAPSFQV